MAEHRKAGEPGPERICEEAGHVVPRAFIDDALEELARPFPFGLSLTTDLPKPTLRGRIRSKWHECRWAIHDRLYPDCYSEED